MNKPIENSYYTGVERVYAGEYPTGYDGKTGKLKLLALLDFGITDFIDLTEEGELLPYSQWLPQAVSYTRFPIKDQSIPYSYDDVIELIDKITNITKHENRKVYIHCWGGIGRTGTIVGCLLGSSLSYSSLDVGIYLLRNAFRDYPKSAYFDTPETKEQETFIEKFPYTYFAWLIQKAMQCKP